MITRKQLETALDDESKDPYKIDIDADHDVKVINLLRDKIPYEEVKSIIRGAKDDVIYLCDIDVVLPYLTEDDLIILADCNVWIDTDVDSLALFV